MCDIFVMGDTKKEPVDPAGGGMRKREAEPAVRPNEKTWKTEI